jgi:hypothetical protein
MVKDLGAGTGTSTQLKISADVIIEVLVVTNHKYT